MKRVFRAPSLLQVAHHRNLLLVAGIESELRNQYLAGAMGELPMLETWPQLDADEVRALRVLREAAAPARGSAWVCEVCGERSEPQFTSCWRCGTDSHGAPGN